jgi:hypothetical protein
MEDYESVIPIDVFLSLEQQIIGVAYQIETLEEYQVDMIHIINKMLFDALNEQLDIF